MATATQCKSVHLNFVREDEFVVSVTFCTRQEIQCLPYAGIFFNDWLGIIFLKLESVKTRKSSKLKVHFQVESPPGQRTGPSKCHLNRIVTLRCDPGCFFATVDSVY